jgi:hypothetical protein
MDPEEEGRSRDDPSAVRPKNSCFRKKGEKAMLTGLLPIVLNLSLLGIHLLTISLL